MCIATMVQDGDRADRSRTARNAGRGEDAARAFYADVLGLSEVTKPPHLATRGGCWFGSGSVRIHLGVDAVFRAAKKAHPALIVSDLAALIERLGARGHKVAEDQPLEGYDRCYVDDPFGNRIELMEPIKIG